MLVVIAVIRSRTDNRLRGDLERPWRRGVMLRDQLLVALSASSHHIVFETEHSTDPMLTSILEQQTCHCFTTTVVIDLLLGPGGGEIKCFFERSQS